MKKWTHSAAFAHFGTKPKNVQWSWSARNEDDKTVVATFWQDQFVKRDGRLIYSIAPLDLLKPDTRPGFRELMENLEWAQNHCNGLFKVIIATAKDKTAQPRSIGECFPSKMIMRIKTLDPTAGLAKAEAEGL